jgi:hypothetical protein
MREATTMAIRSAVLPFVVFVMMASGATGSQELYLPWSTFRIDLGTLGSVGVIEIYGVQAERGLSRVAVKAFGREFEFTPAQLKQLEGLTINGVEVTYEAGYPEVGGRTIYLLFSMGRVKQRVALSEHGGISVGARSSP